MLYLFILKSRALWGTLGGFDSQRPLLSPFLLPPYRGPSLAPRWRVLASVPSACDVGQAAAMGPPRPPGPRKLGDSGWVLSRAGPLRPCVRALCAPSALQFDQAPSGARAGL